MSLPLSVLGVNAATLLNSFALLAACPGVWLLSVTRRREQRALAHLAALSEERAVDQPMLFQDVRTQRAQRFAYRLGFACLGLALMVSWFSTHL